MAEKDQTQKLDRRVVKTQRAIRQAFHKLLIENGLNKITVSALAREADIDRKTFYLHFSSIDELIAQEASILVDRVAHALSAPAQQSEAIPSFNMKRVLIELAAVVEENIELYQHVISSLSIDQMVDALIEPVRKATIDNDSKLRAANDRHGLDYLIRFYIAGTLSVFIQWFTEDRDKPIESIVDIVEQATGIKGFEIAQ